MKKIILMMLSLIGSAALAQEHVHDSGSYTERMAVQHAADTPAPSAAVQEKAEAAVSSTTVTYGSVDGKALNGYLAFPVNQYGPLPAVLMFHEWWGLNDNIKAMARRLAAQGYAVLAADFYNGQVAQTPDAARSLMQAALGDEAALAGNIRSAYGYLKSSLKSKRVGTLGWCFGGSMSYQAGLTLSRKVDATVIYYGFVGNRDAAELRQLKAPVLGLFGAEDKGIPVEDVKKFESGLKALGHTPEIRIYAGAGHAFANSSGTAYKAEAAQDAWNRTLAFLRQHLQR